MKINGHELAVIEGGSLAADVRGVVSLEPGRLGRAKAAYTTRRVSAEAVATLLTGDLEPHAGDLVLARVTKLGQHSRIELGSGRRAQMYVGDEIVVCYGNRYAPDQYEAVVPESLGPCHLVAGGGIAARMLSRHRQMRSATEIQPLGLLGDRHAQRVNLIDHALPSPKPQRQRCLTIAVVGTAMNAGKTTAAAHLIKGLSRSGLRVGAAKVTGTGAGGDLWLMQDSGAKPAYDFTDAGLASTYCVPPAELEHAFLSLTDHLYSAGVDAVVLEVADGLLQAETAALLGSAAFASRVDGVIFAAGDAMGALAGVDWLRRCRLNVLAVSGVLSSSTLASREAERATGLPAVGLDRLSDPEITALVARQLRGVAMAEAV